MTLKWQYRVLSLRRTSERESSWFDSADKCYGHHSEIAVILNDLGAEGFECFQIFYDERGGSQAFFKRPMK